MAVVRPLAVDPTEGLPAEIGSADIIDTVGGINVDGDIVFQGTNNPNGTVKGLPNPPPTADSAASKAYVDALVSGMDPKESCRVLSISDLSGGGWVAAGAGIGKTLTSPNNNVSNNDFDGVTVAVGDRVLLVNEGANGGNPIHNGIYVVTQLADGTAQPTILTRATDADEDAEVTAGMFTFVTEGTSFADTGWLLITNDPITVDTTPLQFTQFAGTGTYIGGPGIDVTTNVISVDLAASPALEFDVAGNVGKLRVQVDPAGAILRGANGLLISQGNGLEINANVLEVDLAATNPALSFDGVGGLQVDVDAAGALDKLATGLAVRVDGTSITINGTNQLQAIAQPAARLEESVTAQEALNTGDPVEWGTTNDQVRQCRASVTGRIDCIGVVESAATAGGTTTLVRRGVAVGVLTAATVGNRYFVGSGGGLVQGISSLGPGDWIIYVGTAKNATDLEVMPRVVARKVL